MNLPPPVALFDLDGTLCDYDTALLVRMQNLQAPEETPIKEIPRSDNIPSYLSSRMNLIRSNEAWWEGLPQFKLGFDVWGVALVLGFRRVILTQGPKRSPISWSGKKRWVDKNLGVDTDMIITRDKSLVYGKVLVDDYPDYIEEWLKWRPRGLVIMPAGPHNRVFTHSQVVRYDGNNLARVSSEMERVRNEYLTGGVEACQ